MTSRNLSARSIISATTALGLFAFTTISAFTAGVTAPVTQLAFGLLAIFGLLEIALLSYAPRRFLVRPMVARPVAVRARLAASARTMVRVPALVEYPVYRGRAA